MLELINVLVGGVSAVAALAALWMPYRSVNTADALRTRLRTVGRPGMKTFWDEDQVLVQYLEHAAVLAGPLKRRIIERFMTVLTGVATGSYFVYIDFPTAVTSQVENLEWWDVALLVGQVFGAVIGATAKLFSEDEKLFLLNASRLNTWFYRDVVEPALRRFNQEMASSEALKRASWIKADEDARVDERLRGPGLPVAKRDPSSQVTLTVRPRKERAKKKTASDTNGDNGIGTPSQQSRPLDPMSSGND